MGTRLGWSVTTRWWPAHRGGCRPRTDGQEARDGGDDAATRERTAPDPDAPEKPESPTDLGKAGWRFTGKAALAEFQRDQCTDLAAALTYYSVLSVFPAILALVSLLGVFGQGEATTDALLDVLDRLGQDQVAAQLEEPINGDVHLAGRRDHPGHRPRWRALGSASGYVGPSDAR